MINTKTAIAVAKAVALMLVASSAHAQVTNLVTNGSFENTTLASGASKLITNSNLTGWHITTDTYSFLVAPGKADVVMDPSVAAPSNTKIKLWSTQNGGLNAIPATSPDGGRFLGSDGAAQSSMGTIYQSVNVTAGKTYTLSFYQAAGQQWGFTGATTEQWRVTLGGTIQYGNLTLNNGQTLTGAGQLNGGQSLVSALMTNPSKGFQGWQQQTMEFTANTNGPTLLGFLAMGTPKGAPPFSLLDGVSMVESVPEPEEWAMMLVGAGLVSYQVRRKQAKVAV